MSADSTQSTFPHGYCYTFPQGRAAAPSPFSENTLLVDLSGPGALQITNKQILHAIGKEGNLSLVTMDKCQVLQPEDFQQRLILPATKLPLNGIRTSHGSGSSKVFIVVSDPNKPSYTFFIDWVPHTVPPEEMTKVINSFCVADRISRNDNLMRYYVTTRTEVCKIPHWLHISNLIASDDTIRSLRVQVKGREEHCQYCDDVSHPWYRCKLKSKVLKQRKKIHDEKMKKLPPKKPDQELPPPKAVPPLPPKGSATKFVTPPSTPTKQKKELAPPKTATLPTQGKPNYLARAETIKRKNDEQAQAEAQLRKLTTKHQKEKTREIIDETTPAQDLSLPLIQNSPLKEEKSQTPPRPPEIKPPIQELSPQLEIPLEPSPPPKLPPPFIEPQRPEFKLGDKTISQEKVDNWKSTVDRWTDRIREDLSDQKPKTEKEYRDLRRLQERVNGRIGKIYASSGEIYYPKNPIEYHILESHGLQGYHNHESLKQAKKGWDKYTAIRPWMTDEAYVSKLLQTDLENPR